MSSNFGSIHSNLVIAAGQSVRRNAGDSTFEAFTPFNDAATQTANLIYGGPSTGSPAAPTFRTLVPADIPNISAVKITSGLTSTRVPFFNGTSLVDDSGLTFDSTNDRLTTGDLTLTNSKTINVTRTMPTTVGNAVDIGSFALTQGAGAFDIYITVANSGHSLSKHFEANVLYNSTNNVWMEIVPKTDSGPLTYGQDFALDVNVNNGTTSFRIRRTVGTTAGTAVVTIIHQGVVADAFTASTSTSSPSAPTDYQNSDSKSRRMYLTGLGTNAYINSFKDANGDGYNFNFESSGSYLRVAEYPVVAGGVYDVFFQARPVTTSGYGYLESLDAAGMIVGTSNNTAVIFRPNRTEKARIDASALTLANAVNIIVGTATGTKIGTASTQKIGFFGVAPVTQRTGIPELVDSSGGTPQATLTNPGGSYSQSWAQNLAATVAYQNNYIQVLMQELGLTT